MPNGSEKRVSNHPSQKAFKWHPDLKVQVWRFICTYYVYLSIYIYILGGLASQKTVTTKILSFISYTYQICNSKAKNMYIYIYMRDIHERFLHISKIHQQKNVVSTPTKSTNYFNQLNHPTMLIFWAPLPLLYRLPRAQQGRSNTR